MLTRRELLKRSAQAGIAVSLGLPFKARADEGVEVNDVQSQLNATLVNRIVKPKTVEDIQAVLKAAERESRAVSAAGGRHAMGGQQFGRDMILIDTKTFNRVVSFDKEKGIVEV